MEESKPEVADALPVPPVTGPLGHYLQLFVRCSGYHYQLFHTTLNTMLRDKDRQTENCKNTLRLSEKNQAFHPSTMFTFDEGFERYQDVTFTVTMSILSRNH